MKMKCHLLGDSCSLCVMFVGSSTTSWLATVEDAVLDEMGNKFFVLRCQENLGQLGWVTKASNFYLWVTTSKRLGIMSCLILST